MTKDSNKITPFRKIEAKLQLVVRDEPFRMIENPNGRFEVQSTELGCLRVFHYFRNELHERAAHMHLIPDGKAAFFASLELEPRGGNS